MSRQLEERFSFEALKRPLSEFLVFRQFPAVKPHDNMLAYASILGAELKINQEVAGVVRGSHKLGWK